MQLNRTSFDRNKGPLFLKPFDHLSVPFIGHPIVSKWKKKLFQNTHKKAQLSIVFGLTTNVFLVFGFGPMLPDGTILNLNYDLCTTSMPDWLTEWLNPVSCVLLPIGNWDSLLLYYATTETLLFLSLSIKGLVPLLLRPFVHWVIESVRTDRHRSEYIVECWPQKQWLIIYCRNSAHWEY